MRGEQYGKTSKDHDHQCRNELTERKKKKYGNEPLYLHMRRNFSNSLRQV